MGVSVSLGRAERVMLCQRSDLLIETLAADDSAVWNIVEEQVLASLPTVVGEIRRIEDGRIILVDTSGVNGIEDNWSITLSTPIARMPVPGERGNKARGAPVVPVNMLVDQLLKINETATARVEGLSSHDVVVFVAPRLRSGVFDKVQALRDVLVGFRVVRPGTTIATATHDAAA